MNFPVQHLSDEAVAAYADGVLGRTARMRAERHLAECPECTYAVSIQREAVFALRGAPLPALPSGLLDRLRAVPTTTILTSPPLALSPDGSAAFPAHGTSVAERDDTATMSAHPIGLTPSIVPRSRWYGRLGSVGTATVVAVAAVAVLTVGLRASEGAGTSPAAPAPAEVDQQSGRATTAAIEPALVVAPAFMSAPQDESARP
jgi:putative zinc finger protein